MKGIMFIEPLFLRTISGNKTMTRRSGGLDAVNGNPKKNISTNPDLWEPILGKFMTVPDKPGFYQSFQNKMGDIVTCYSAHNIGDTVYLKEPTHKYITGQVVYQYGNNNFNPDFRKWDNKMFMNSDRARYFIRITNVKCERLKDISKEDCIAEGIETLGEWDGKPLYKNYTPINKSVHELPVFSYLGEDEKLSFFTLYMFANKVKDVPNLWVWAYSYELINK